MFTIGSLWLSTDILRRRYWSTLVQVMYCYITWTYADLISMEFCGIRLTTISQEALKLSFHAMSEKIAVLR